MILRFSLNTPGDDLREAFVSNVIPLQLLHPGEAGCIYDISGCESLVARLEEMGLRAGVNVKMVQPGRPCIIAYDHQRLSFRGDAETTVLVEVKRPA